MRCQLSTSFRCSSPFSSACNTATGALPALPLVPTHAPFFNGLQYGCRCVAHSDAHLPFQLLTIRVQVHCTLSTSFRRASYISTTCNTSTGALPALYLVLVSSFIRLQYGYRCIASSPARSNDRLLLQRVAIWLQVRCPLRRASSISTPCNTTTGVWHALYLVPTRASHFNHLQYVYRCVASSLPRSDARLLFIGLQYGYRCVASSPAHSDARLLFQRVAIRPQVRCPLRRASPISTACNTATGALPALYIVPSRVSHFNRVQYGYSSVASSLPRCDARLLFQPLPIGLPVCCPLSTWFRCVSPFSAAADLATCSPLVSICPI